MSPTPPPPPEKSILKPRTSWSLPLTAPEPTPGMNFFKTAHLRKKKGGPFRLLVKILLGYMFLTAWWVLFYRFVNPYPTVQMKAYHIVNGPYQATYKPIYDISPSLVTAVIAAEDAKFCQHYGFDLDAIRTAYQRNKHSDKKLYGGSTISQQTAKNTFLWQGRNWFRKGLETHFTLWMQLFWSKTRVMEIYLNVIEFDQGVYGAEAAAQHYFKKSAKDLNDTEAALLAAILPNPRDLDPKHPSAYVRNRTERVLEQMALVRRDGLAACVDQDDDE